MESALELFANEGFHNTSIQKIAKKAGISKGLLYNYFNSKEELIRTIIIKGFEDLMVFLDPNHDGILTIEEIGYFIEETFKLLDKNLHFWQLYFSILLQPAVLKLVESKFKDIIDSLLGMLEKYFEQAGKEDPRSEAILLGAIIDGIGMHYIMNPENFPLELVKQKIIEIYAK